MPAVRVTLVKAKATIKPDVGPAEVVHLGSIAVDPRASSEYAADLRAKWLTDALAEALQGRDPGTRATAIAYTGASIAYAIEIVAVATAIVAKREGTVVRYWPVHLDDADARVIAKNAEGSE